MLATPCKLDLAWINATVWTGVQGTRIVDLEGAFVVPGFIDYHTHFLRASQTLALAG